MPPRLTLKRRPGPKERRLLPWSRGELQADRQPLGRDAAGQREHRQLGEAPAVRKAGELSRRLDRLTVRQPWCRNGRGRRQDDVDVTEELLDEPVPLAPELDACGVVRSADALAEPQPPLQILAEELWPLGEALLVNGESVGPDQPRRGVTGFFRTR